MLLTFSDEHIRQRLLLQDLDVHRRAVPHLVIDVIQASSNVSDSPANARMAKYGPPSQQHIHTLHHRLVVHTYTELGETAHGRGTDDGVLEHDSVVDVPDELGRVSRLGPLETKKVENADRELGELAVLDELAQVGKGFSLVSTDPLRAEISTYRPPCSP
jgi:hypothetical protein